MANDEAFLKTPLPTHERANTVQIAKIFVVCDQKDTAPGEDAFYGSAP